MSTHHFLRFQVWIVQLGIKMQSIGLTEMTLLASGVDSTADFLNKAYFQPFMIRVTGDDGFCAKPLPPETFGCAVYRHKTTFPLMWTITLNTS